MAVLESIKQHITDAYNKVEAKKGTISSPKNLQNLAGAIESIPTEAHTAEARTVELNMSGETQVVSPSADGKLMSKVTINRPDTFLSTNIKKDVTIAGVTGTYTSDATAAANQILSGQTAYVNGERITGTIPTYDGASENLTA